MHQAEPRVCVGDRNTYVRLWEWGLRGTNQEIGCALGCWGREELDAAPLPSAETSRIQAQRSFFRRHYRPFYDRMCGVAQAAGLKIGEPTHDLATLWFDVGMPGCSSAFVPGGRMDSGHHHILRNMDLGVDLGIDVEHPASSRIMLVNMEPDEGYASLSVVVFDLMGAMDGINEKGLVVVCNSHGDHRLTGSFRPEPPYTCEPVGHAEPGLNEMQVVRYLLDMCASVDEAKEALLSLRTYYCFTPCLYMIADASGRACVCEKSSSGNRIVFTDCDGGPLVMTNFGRTRFASDDEMPEADGLEQGFMYARYRSVTRGIELQESLETSHLHDIARAASFDVLCGPRAENDMHPSRTIYTTTYDLDARCLTISCYLGESDAGAVHSEPLSFSLEPVA